MPIESGHATAARNRLDKACLGPKLTFNERNRLIDLYRWYAWKLPTTKRRSIGLDPKYLDWLNDGYWQAFNPSILLQGDRYLVNLRHANYFTTNAKNYEFRAQHGKVITRNVIMEMDVDLGVLTDNFAPIEIDIPEKYVINKSSMQMPNAFKTCTSVFFYTIVDF